MADDQARHANPVVSTDQAVSTDRVVSTDQAGPADPASTVVDSTPDVALVRPYVASLVEPAPDDQRSGQGFIVWTDPTEPTTVRPAVQAASVIASRASANGTTRKSKTGRTATGSTITAGGAAAGRAGKARRAGPHGRGRAGAIRVGIVVTASIALVAALAGAYSVWMTPPGPTALAFQPVPVGRPSFPMAVQAAPRPTATRPRSTSPITQSPPTQSPSATARPDARPSAAPRSPAAPSSNTPGALLGTSTPTTNTNLAAGRPVSDDGHVTGYPPTSAVDGDPRTYWESTNHVFPASFTIDLGAAVAVGRIVVKLPPRSSWAARTQTLTVSGSSDDSHYTTMVGSAGYPFDPATGNVATITFGATPARYVRLTFTANTVWPAAQLAELEIYTS